jgi:hypothetical protein
LIKEARLLHNELALLVAASKESVDELYNCGNHLYAAWNGHESIQKYLDGQVGLREKVDKWMKNLEKMPDDKELQLVRKKLDQKEKAKNIANSGIKMPLKKSQPEEGLVYFIISLGIYINRIDDNMCNLNVYIL